MSREYVLLVALYADSDEAVADLRDLTAPGGLPEVVVGSGILHRGWGRSVLQQGDGGTLAYGIGTGAAAGVVAGAFLALPLVGAAVGAVIGGLVGRRVRVARSTAWSPCSTTRCPWAQRRCSRWWPRTGWWRCVRGWPVPCAHPGESWTRGR